MKRRKLLAPKVLNKMLELSKLGVPLAKIIRNYPVDMSAPAVAKLVEEWDSLMLGPYISNHMEVHKSFTPDWLDLEVKVAQEQPEGWKYIGEFPSGEWLNENN